MVGGGGQVESVGRQGGGMIWGGGGGQVESVGRQGGGG